MGRKADQVDIHRQSKYSCSQLKIFVGELMDITPLDLQAMDNYYILLGTEAWSKILREGVNTINQTTENRWPRFLLFSPELSEMHCLRRHVSVILIKCESWLEIVPVHLIETILILCFKRKLDDLFTSCLSTYD